MHHLEQRAGLAPVLAAGRGHQEHLFDGRLRTDRVAQAQAERLANVCDRAGPDVFGALSIGRDAGVDSVDLEQAGDVAFVA